VKAFTVMLTLTDSRRRRRNWGFNKMTVFHSSTSSQQNGLSL